MKQQIEADLARAVQDLPPERIQEVIDFAGYLRIDAPQRGTVEAIFQTLEQAGELDALLAEIQRMRE